jgi:hypothetical protein
VGFALCIDHALDISDGPLAGDDAVFVETIAPLISARRAWAATADGV